MSSTMVWRSSYLVGKSLSQKVSLTEPGLQAHHAAQRQHGALKKRPGLRRPARLPRFIPYTDIKPCRANRHDYTRPRPKDAPHLSLGRPGRGQAGLPPRVIIRRVQEIAEMLPPAHRRGPKHLFAAEAPVCSPFLTPALPMIHPHGCLAMGYQKLK